MSEFLSTEGRLNRGGYFLQVFGVILVIAVAGGLWVGLSDDIFFDPEKHGLYPLGAAVILLFFPTAKRLHDLNWSAWLYLINLIPIVGTILELMLVFKRGTRGPNQYGPDPLGGTAPSLPTMTESNTPASPPHPVRSVASLATRSVADYQTPEVLSSDLAAATVMLNEIKAQHQDKIDELQKMHALQIQNLKQKHESEINRLREAKGDNSSKLLKEVNHLDDLVAKKESDLTKAYQRISFLEERLSVSNAIGRFLNASWSGIQCVTAKASRATRNGCEYMLNNRQKCTKPLSAKYACPNCNQHIEIESDLIGSQIDCPACSKIFVPGK